MISGLYTAASGLIAQTYQQDVIANNLANASTTGYKKDTALYVPFPTVFLHRVNDVKVPMPNGIADAVVPIGYMGRGVQLRSDGVRPNITQEGSMIETANPLNFAIKGNGMFVVMTPGGLRYTRDGNFNINSDGMLVTKDGYPVLGQSGEIIIDGDEVNVDKIGRVFVDNYEIDTFRVALFDKTSPLRKQGDNLFYTLDNAPLPEDEYVEQTQVLQGYIEQSNVNVVREMVDMISAYRAYEASQKAVQAHDTTLGKAVNDVGQIQI